MNTLLILTHGIGVFNILFYLRKFHYNFLTKCLPSIPGHMVTSHEFIVHASYTPYQIHLIIKFIFLLEKFSFLQHYISNTVFVTFTKTMQLQTTNLNTKMKSCRFLQIEK